MRSLRTTLITALFAGPWTAIHAQCVQQFSLGPDTVVCLGNTVLLSASAGFQSYAWSTGSTATSITVGTANTYSCTVTDFGTSGELVVNGDFSAGSTGFSSDYVPGYGGTYGLLSGAGTYATSTSPQLTHVNFANFGDHTAGPGNMLVVNGAQIPGQNIWCQTVIVQPNTDYAFSAWLATAVSESPAQMVFTVNGIVVGDPLLAPFATGQWLNFYGIWNSGSATSAAICISNQNSADSGNDFALDDISFAPFCTYTDEIIVSFQADPQPDLGDDVQVCEGVPVSLDATTPNADQYVWQNGSASALFDPVVSGVYWVDVTENGCTTRDSVEVTFETQPTVELGPDQERCLGELAVLNAFFAGAEYEWQDGSTGSTLTINGTGIYSVTVDLNNCSAADAVSFLYQPLPIVDLGPDTMICADTSLTLDVERPGGSYLWDNGEIGAQRMISEGSLYWVEVTESGCTSRDSLELAIIPIPFVDLGPDLLLCKGLNATLDAYGPGLTYLWSSGDTTAELAITEEDVYHVTVTNTCGQMDDSVTVTQDQCDCPVFVPNGFTPDDDGVNEGFRPVFDCPIEKYMFRVFDRWGGLVWASEDPRESWNGGGNDPNGTASGIYAWMLEIRPKTVNERSLRTLFGHVMLLR